MGAPWEHPVASWETVRFLGPRSGILGRSWVWLGHSQVDVFGNGAQIPPFLATEYVIAPPPVEADASALGVNGDAVVSTAVVGDHVTVVAAGLITTSCVACGAALYEPSPA